MCVKKGEIPVEHRVIWKFGSSAGINAIWQGEWRKRWLCDCEWFLIVDDDMFPEPYCDWKPVKEIIYNYSVKADLKKYNLKFK